MKHILQLPCNHLVELLKIKFPVLVLVASLIENKNHIEFQNVKKNSSPPHVDGFDHKWGLHW